VGTADVGASRSGDVESVTSARSWWLAAVGVVALVVGIGRLVLDVSATALGTTTSCGNAAQWIQGTGPARTPTGTLRGVCGGALHNASIEGTLALVAGIALLIAWLVVVRAWWPLVVLAVLVVLILGAVYGHAGPALGIALVVFAAFAAFRLVHRLRRSTPERPY
jgi:hypothetical protein